MKRIFRVQKTMMVLFIVAATVVFVFSLYFMTDFKDLFGLQLKANRPIMEFHDTTMQGFNQSLFWFSLLGLVTIIFQFFLEIGKKVPDLFAIAVEGLCLLVTGGFALHVLVALPKLEQIYLQLDFSKYKMEGGAEYVMKTSTFTAGSLIYFLNLLVCLVFFAVLIISHVTYKKELKGRS
jgi:ABC-type multidrug transport system permease subunit